MRKVGKWIVSLRTGSVELSTQARELLHISDSRQLDISLILSKFEDEHLEKFREFAPGILELGKPYMIDLKLKGRQEWVSVSCMPHLNDDEVDYVEGLIATCRSPEIDILELRSQVSVEVLHEAMGPLTIIKNNTNFLKNVLLEGRNQKALEDMDNILLAVSRVQTLFSEMRAKLRNEQTQVRCELNIILEQVRFYATQRLGILDIDFKIENNCGNPYLAINESELLQVFTNLINNSSDAISILFEKWVHIKVEEEDSHLNILFIDSGKGIPAHIQRRIFDKMYTTKGDSGGTGIGLDLCKQILEQNKGDISYIEGRSNTTFLIKVPKLSM